MLLIVEPRTLDRAIERLAGRNRSVGEDARAAIEWLTRGDEEGEEVPRAGPLDRGRPDARPDPARTHLRAEAQLQLS